MERIVLRANAKVNLFLDVIRRREDGYHEIETLFQSVDLFDELTISKAKAGVELVCDDSSLPTDERNIAYRAAELILGGSQIDRRLGVRIELRKKIPISAGLGGGSADAAAVLVGVDRIFELGYGLEKLAKLGAALGADVPFCVIGGRAKGEGIGERLTLASGLPKLWLLILNPNFSVSTAWVYKNFNFGLTKASKDVNILVRNLREGDLIAAAANMYNALEETVLKSYPEVGRLKDDLVKAGALGALMSGSGPTVLGLARDEFHARELGEILRHKAPFCAVVSSSECGIC